MDAKFDRSSEVRENYSSGLLKKTNWILNYALKTGYCFKKIRRILKQNMTILRQFIWTTNSVSAFLVSRILFLFFVCLIIIIYFQKLWAFYVSLRDVQIYDLTKTWYESIEIWISLQSKVAHKIVLRNNLEQLCLASCRS